MNAKEPSIARLVAPGAARQLVRFRQSIEERLQGHVLDVVLFGSRARREGRRNSDYDIAILIDDDLEHRGAERLAEDVALPFIRQGYHFRPVVLRTSIFARPVTNPLASNIARDGVSI